MVGHFECKLIEMKDNHTNRPQCHCKLSECLGQGAKAVYGCDVFQAKQDSILNSRKLRNKHGFNCKTLKRWNRVS